MKKKSRFLTGLLSAVMALSLFAMPAAAETANETTILKDKGSLTIEKYEGKESGGIENAKPFPGIEFTIYKVADIKQNYDATTKQIELQYESLVEGLTITSDTKYDDATKQLIDAAVKSNKLSSQKNTTKLTEDKNKAVAKFDGLAVGVYLVVESYAPSQVVSPSANFLVSIPMTNANGDGWVYDVVAQPKNETVYGGVTLVKEGKELNANGNPVTAKLAGVKFVLQAKNTTTNEWETKGTFTTGDGNNGTTLGQITVDGLAPGEYRFIETAGVNGYIADGTKPYGFTVGEDGKVDGETTYSFTVSNEKPDLDKTVKNGEGDYVKDADYSVGDMVEWKVSVAVPSNVDKLATFNIVDNMSEQLTWKKDDNDLKIATDNGTVLNETDDYTIDAPDRDTAGAAWTIKFTPDGKKKLHDEKVSRIDVTFKTELNSEAKIGAAGNLNNAELKYSNAIYPENDPQNPNNGNKPGEDTIHDEAIVYTFKLDAVKVDGTDTKKTLSGAKFNLYRYTGNVANPTEADLKAKGSDFVGEYTSGENGNLNIKGLKKGTYYLVETVSPVYKDDKGNEHHYNLLKEPVKVEIAAEYSIVTDTEIGHTYDDGNVTSTTTKTTITKTTMTNDGNQGTYVLTIKNNKGFDLPTTGGFGTLLFSGIGALLVVGGVGVLMSTKKKKGNA